MFKKKNVSDTHYERAKIFDFRESQRNHFKKIIFFKLNSFHFSVVIIIYVRTPLLGSQPLIRRVNKLQLVKKKITKSFVKFCFWLNVLLLTPKLHT